MIHRTPISVAASLCIALLALFVGCADQDADPTGESVAPIAAQESGQPCPGFIDEDGDGKCDKAGTDECPCAKAGGCDCAKAGGCDCAKAGGCDCAKAGGGCPKAVGGCPKAGSQCGRALEGR